MSEQSSRQLSSILPDQFQDLTPFLRWAIPEIAMRLDQCGAVSFEETTEFYNAVFPRIEEIIQYLNQFPPDAMPQEAENLANMALSLANAAVPVELYHSNDAPFCQLRGRMSYRAAISSER